jgi:hypothetical protein
MAKLANHQYAIDVQGNWVNATQTAYKPYQVFWCECPERHKLKLVKPSGLSGKRSFCDYFAHVSSPDKQLVTEPICRAGGESLEHRMAKHKLREMAGSYFFATSHCQCCHSEVLVDSAGGSVKLEVVSADKLWRYDCLLKNKNMEVALEVVYKHLTGSVKVDSTRKSGMEIAEFRTCDVLEMHGRTKLDNIKMRVEMCHNCSVLGVYTAEVNELLKLDESISNGYQKVPFFKVTKKQKIQQLTKKQQYDNELKAWEESELYWQEFRKIKLPFQK